MKSHPGPSGSQLTVGGAGSGAAGRGGTGDGMAFGPRGKTADWASGLTASGFTAAAEAASDVVVVAVDGEKKGPVSNEQPLAQPVAAGPTNVGEDSPKLVEVTELLDCGAAATPETKSKQPTSAIAKIAAEMEMVRVLAVVLVHMANINPPLRIPAWEPGISSTYRT
jgi:hypothetical protein